MDTVSFVLAVAGICLSSFSLGYSLAMYFTSSYYIRTQVTKRLWKALDERCARCYEHSATIDRAKDASETTNEAMDM